MSTEDGVLSRWNMALQRALSGLFLVTGFVIPAVGLANSAAGAWLSPQANNWPLIAIHAVLVPDGRVLTYGTDGDGTQTGYFIYDVWDPAQGLGGGHLTLPNMTLTDLFCSGQTVLPQNGSVLIAGGDNWISGPDTPKGNSNTNLYADQTLTRSSEMYRPRWYASTTALPNGEIYIQGGTGGTDRPEVRQLDGTFRLLTGANTVPLWYFYPRNFVMADGRLFGFDTRGHMTIIDPAGAGSITQLSQFSGGYAGANGSTAMFRPGKILQLGGNSSATLVIDFTGGAPVLTPAQPLSSVRKWMTSTVLADGRVLVTGGSSRANELIGVNNAAEIWNPDTGRWSVGASAARARLYHSTALLLPDASVLVGGGGAPGPLDNRHAEIYYPPYLFRGDQRAQRPVIAEAPSRIELGSTFQVSADSADISRVTLIRTGSVTHGYNVDQRFMELSFSGTGGQLAVTAPRYASEAPPGYYLLFLFDSAGVPSVGKIVQIGIPAGDRIPPSIPTGLTVTATSTNSVDLRWAASRDAGGSGIRGYRIHREPPGTSALAITDTALSDTGLSAHASYTYRISAFDGAGNESARSAPVNATTSSSAAGEALSVTLSPAVLTPVQLDQLGTADWVHWGLTGAGAVNRKAGVSAQISGITTVGATLRRFDHQPAAWTTHRWIGGTPTATTSGFAGGVQVVGLNKGYELSVATGSTGRRLKIFFGGQNTLSQVDVTLTGANGSTRRLQIGNLSGRYRHVLNVDYPAGSAGQLLRVRHVITAGTGPIRIQSASLQTRSGVVNQPPTINNPGPQNSVVGVPVQLQMQAADVDSPVLAFSASGLPAGITIESDSGRLSGAPVEPGLHTVNVSVSDGQSSASTSFTWMVSAGEPLEVTPMPAQAPVQSGATASYVAQVTGGLNPRFKWDFGDGSQTQWLSSPSVTHVFAKAGLYWVTLAVTDDRGVQKTATFQQFVHNPLVPGKPAMSTSLIIAAGNLWVVNPDNDSVSVFSLNDHQRLAEIPVSGGPHTLALSPSGDVWVVARDAAKIDVLEPATLSRSGVILLPAGSMPFGLVFAPDGSAAFVALEATGEVLKLRTTNGAQLGRIAVDGSPRHLSINSNSDRLYVSRYITARLPGEDTVDVSAPSTVGGEVVVIDPEAMVQVSKIILRHSDTADGQNQGRGIPNYLGPAVISPDGASAWVPSKKDNVMRGASRSAQELNHQNTVRAISSRIDLADNTEGFAHRIDLDNAGVASAAAFDPLGILLFVALESSREVAVVDVHNGIELFRFDVGRAPQGIAVSAVGRRLYVDNFMDRSVTVHDLRPLMEGELLAAPVLATLDAVASESLSAEVLTGKQLFYDARDTRLAAEGYMSCASCHNEGGHDGRVWDMSGFGEGLRNTIDLRGRSGGHGQIHWSGNADEVQDLENQIRNLAGGTGLMSNTDFLAGTRRQLSGDPKAGVSAALDALASYVASLNPAPRSPFRQPDGSHSEPARAGAAVFNDLNCAQCHGGPDFSNDAGQLFDIGTIRQPGSGSRSGAPLTGLDVPTLRGLWLTAPYLHDGSAGTLHEAVRAHDGIEISTADLDALVAWLLEIDDLEPNP